MEVVEGKRNRKYLESLTKPRPRSLHTLT